MLAVRGCYWAASSEIKIYDFSKPLEPFDAIVDDELIGAEKFKGWNNDNSCNIYRCYEIRKSDGKPCYSLTEEEQDEVDSNWEELEDLKKEDIVWRKKSG